jgi:hypothetical protein
MENANHVWLIPVAYKRRVRYLKPAKLIVIPLRTKEFLQLVAANICQLSYEVI